MASSFGFPCLLFFLFFTTLVLSPQTQARDSQLFNKQTPKSHSQEPPLKKNEVEEEEPSFFPQTSGTGYGLYGHETRLDPPSTTSNNNDNNNNNNNNNNEEISHHDQKNYVNELKGLSFNGFVDDVSKKSNNEGVRNYDYSYDNDRYGGVGYNGVVERQEMSDTRFLENGKYTNEYDIDADQMKRFDDFDQYDHHYRPNYKSYTNKYNNHYYHRNGHFGHFNHGNKNYGEVYNNKYYNNGNSMQRGHENQMYEGGEFEFDP